MPESMIHLFKGDLFWHMPKDLVIDVGPTRHIFPPKPFKEDTEKYGNQTTLTKTGQPEHCLLLELWLNPIRWCARIWDIWGDLRGAGASRPAHCVSPRV